MSREVGGRWTEDAGAEEFDKSPVRIIGADSSDAIAFWASSFTCPGGWIAVSRVPPIELAMLELESLRE